MDNFSKALKVILSYEGGYVDNPKDPGGETNFGISKRQYPNEDIKNISQARVAEIYKNDYWNPCNCDNMPYGVALSVFDMAVNAGVGTSCKMLQRAVGVKDDGKIGPMTIAAVNKMDASSIVKKFTIQRVLYYAGLSTFPTFGKSWVSRTINSLNIQ